MFVDQYYKFFRHQMSVFGRIQSNHEFKIKVEFARTVLGNHLIVMLHLLALIEGPECLLGADQEPPLSAAGHLLREHGQLIVKLGILDRIILLPEILPRQGWTKQRSGLKLQMHNLLMSFQK